MAWDDVKPCWFTSWGTILLGFTITGRISLIYPYTPLFQSKSASSRGGHMQAPIPTLHHTHTHMPGTHAGFQMIPTFSWTSSQIGRASCRERVENSVRDVSLKKKTA